MTKVTAQDIYAGVRKGELVGLRGNPKAATNFGFLCVKGFKGYTSMYHPDRLKYPVKRVGERGDGAGSGRGSQAN